MATARLDVVQKIPDTRAAVRRRAFRALGAPVTAIVIADSYLLDGRFASKELARIGAAFANPLTEKFFIHRDCAPRKFSFAIEIGYLPGVTDNVGATARETIEDLLKKKFRPGEAVYSAQVLYVDGKLREEDAKKIAESLYNPLIQRARILSFRDYRREKGFGTRVPKVKLAGIARTEEVNLWVDDEELARIGNAGILNPDGSRRGPLALDLEAMKVIRNYFHRVGRGPTDLELESLAQTWSEHCKHTIFADPLDEIEEGIFKRYIRRATEVIRRAKGKEDICVSVFTDNAGGVAFDEDYLITHKVETHNSPSALDPFGGAITGIVGVNRDALGFGLGAKPVINTYGFCFADPRDASVYYRDPAGIQKLMPAKRIMQGVIAGINAGGNQSGIPTPQGFVFFDRRFRGKPLVFAGTVGLIPRLRPASTKGSGRAQRGSGRFLYKKKARPGEYIVVIGGRVGLDGIHGATFSSVALDVGSPAAAVQIGDPITQKKLSDALVKEARDRNLYTSLTDNGAGGISCSVAEMAKESGGFTVDLQKVPLKYPGLAPWQIWISESQERMTLAVPKSKWNEFEKLMKSRGVEAVKIGEFTASGRAVVRHKSKTVMDMEMDFLHDGRPVKFQESLPAAALMKKSVSRPSVKIPDAWRTLIASPNLASFEFISTQYDHEVQAGSVTKPLQGGGRVNAEATVTRPLLSSPKGVVLSQGLYPRYSERDAYAMAAASVDTAVRNAVAAGADPDRLAILDNFCWSSSTDPMRLGQLKTAARACYDTAVAYGAPFISGKDSMFNDFKGYDEKGGAVKISALPTLLISALGVMADAARAVTLDAKLPGDVVYLLGDTKDELGGSEYLALLEGIVGEQLPGDVPKVQPKKNLELYRGLAAAIRSDLVASALALTRGGLAAALTKTALGGNLGLAVHLPKTNLAFDTTLFSESQGRVLVTVNPKNTRRFEAMVKGRAVKLGEVTQGATLRVAYGKEQVSLPLAVLREAYRKTFRGF